MSDQTDLTLEVMAAKIQRAVAEAVSRGGPASRSTLTTILSRLADATPGAAPGEGVQPSAAEEADLQFPAWLVQQADAWATEPDSLKLTTTDGNGSYATRAFTLGDLRRAAGTPVPLAKRLPIKHLSAMDWLRGHEAVSEVHDDRESGKGIYVILHAGWQFPFGEDHSRFGFWDEAKVAVTEAARLASPSPARSDRAATDLCQLLSDALDDADLAGQQNARGVSGQAAARAAVSRAKIEAAVAAIDGAADRQGDGVAAGWKLVPVEPTVEMRDAFHTANEAWESNGEGSPDFQWTAMLASAPTPAPEGVDLPSEEAIAEALFYSVDWTNKETVWADIADDKTAITQGIVRRFRQQAKVFRARLDPQADKVDALRVAAQKAIDVWLDHEYGSDTFIDAMVDLSTALDAPRDGGA